ncbi:MAG TPA: hypothetical protein ENG56_00060 [Candidatus Aenigmarchaeota archaeon]|nr:hypothetical protein [Candidatus Aenigmarchaeota archaeon]
MSYANNLISKLKELEEEGKLRISEIKCRVKIEAKVKGRPAFYTQGLEEKEVTMISLPLSPEYVKERKLEDKIGTIEEVSIKFVSENLDEFLNKSEIEAIVEKGGSVKVRVKFNPIKNPPLIYKYMDPFYKEKVKKKLTELIEKAGYHNLKISLPSSEFLKRAEWFWERGMWQLPGSYFR